MKRMTAKRLRQALDYDSNTGVFVWRHRPDQSQGTNTRWAGKPAGYQRREDARRVIRVDGKLYLASRLAFLWVTGRWPRAEIDHKDTDSGNDRWDNLRPATSYQNRLNKRARSCTGIKGIWLDNRPNRWSNMWHASIMVNKTRYRLGTFNTKEQAAAAYDAASRALHGEFGRGNGI